MAHRVNQPLLASGNMGSNSAGCLHGVYAVVSVGFAHLSLRPWISAVSSTAALGKVLGVVSVRFQDAHFVLMHLV